jgi:hypothetical protein
MSTQILSPTQRPSAPAARAAIARRLRLGSRELELRLTPAAERALAAERGPFDIELELYFSCLIRKRVCFRSEAHTDAIARVPLTDTVTVSFRPVMTHACTLAGAGDAPPALEALPIARPEAFTPRWLALDHRSGKWTGEFGF